MIQQLKSFDYQMYQTYTNGGSPGDYQRVTLDFDKLIEKLCSGEQIAIADVMKPTDKGPTGMGDLMQSRVNSLELIAASPRVFADKDYQHAAQALAGLSGMVSIDMNDPNLNFEDLTKAAVFWVLDFSVPRMKETQNEEESVAVVRFLEQLLAYLLPGESIPKDSLCLEKIEEMAARYIFPQSGNTKVTEKILDLIVPMMPDPDSGIIADALYDYLDRYIPGDAESYTKEERIEAFLKACGWGPVDGTKASDAGETAEDVARTLCTVVALAGTFDVVELPTWLTLALADPADPEKFPRPGPGSASISDAGRRNLQGPHDSCGSDGKARRGIPVFRPAELTRQAGVFSGIY